MAAPIQKAPSVSKEPAPTAEVREAQLRLQTYKSGLQTDGVDGVETRAAVVLFQKKVSLAADGILGPQTLATLRTTTPIDERLLDVRAFRAEVRGVVWMPDGQLVVGTAGGNLYRFAGDPPSMQHSGEVNHRIYRLDRSPDGTRIAVGSADGWVIQLDERMKVIRSHPLDPPHKVYWSRYSATGALACAWGDTQVAVIRRDTPNTVALWRCELATTNLAWSGDELILSTDDALAIMSSNNGTIRKTVDASAGKDLLRELAVSHDGTILVTRGRDPQIDIWDAKTLEHRATIDGPDQTSKASALAFSPTDYVLAVGRADGWLDLLDTSSWTVRERWRAHDSAITSITFGRDRLATGSLDQTAKSWRWSSTQAVSSSLAILDSDTAHGDDALEILRDVRALSRVMLARSLQPPLSIGIFGDWGMGKSFFINKLHDQIERDASLARAAKGRDCAWYGDVIQITFNAWHYVETNLWAALVTHLFDELGRRINPEENEEETRKRLMTELDTARKAKAEATAREDEARDRLAHAKLDIEAAARRIAEVRASQAQLESSDLLQLASDRFQRWVRRKHPNTDKNADLQSLDEAWRKQTEALAVWTGRLRLHFTRPRTWLLLSIVLGLGAVTWVLWNKGFVWPTFSSLTGAITMLVAWVSDATKTALTNLDGVVARLKEAQDLGKKLDEQLGEARESRVAAALRPYEAAKHSAYAALEVARADHERALQSADRAARAVTEAEQAYAEASSGRVLFRFLTERADSRDYRQHLGIISLIRADLVRLSKLVGASKSEEKLATAGSPVAKVERIMLYIDDLDRCPPARVVDVLQAVHLLLGIPDLFVVVVAVDSRWLMRSLANHYDRLLETKDSIRQSTPLDYLGKIFQIPYVVERMNNAGFVNILRGLLPSEPQHLTPSTPPTGTQTDEPIEPKATDAPPQTPAPADDPPPPTTALEKAVSDEAEVAADGQVDVDFADLSPPAMRISEEERVFMEQLGPLISTPRMAKAFVNVYRLLRARMEHPIHDEPTLAEYLTSQQYRVALLMLAFQIGYPEQTHELHRELQAKPDMTLDDHLRDVRAKDGGRAGISACIADLRTRGLLPNEAAIYLTWAERVRRFSFQPWRREQA